MHIAVLMTNTDESDFAHRHSDDGDKWRAVVLPHCPDCQLSVYSVKDGVFPDRPLTDFDGLIVTGSPASVHDGAPWQDRLTQIIQQAAQSKVPLFGACYGHQAIALALGGTVGDNPDGWLFGVANTTVNDPAPWMDGFTGPIQLNAAHKEQVLVAPRGARIINSNGKCPNGGFAIGNSVFTTQYHPEIDPEFMAALVDELEDEMPVNITKLARDSLGKDPENTRFSRWIVQFFRYAGRQT